MVATDSGIHASTTFAVVRPSTAPLFAAAAVLGAAFVSFAIAAIPAWVGYLLAAFGVPALCLLYRHVNRVRRKKAAGRFLAQAGLDRLAIALMAVGWLVGCIHAIRWATEIKLAA